jgi:hypothetical protein
MFTRLSIPALLLLGLISAAPVNVAGSQTCCSKHAYCCSVKAACCRTATTGNTADAAAATDLATLHCCAKHAYCCQVKERCCPRNSAVPEPTAAPVETGKVAAASNSLNCCTKHAYCCSTNAACCHSSPDA